MAHTPSNHRKAHLNELLERFQPDNPDEQGFKERMLDLLHSSEEPFSSKHFVPGHFTASAFVLSPSKKELLLIFHGKLHKWLQPGGHIDPEDTDVLSAAKREVQEEVGISELTLVGDQIFDVDIHDIPPYKEKPAHAHYDIRFLFVAHNQDFQITDEVKDASWFSLEKISQIQSDASVMRAVQRIIEQH